MLMSVDYALCHGPVDWINQIWVKDKPIWCGRVDQRSNVHVRLPDHFGGDDSEGGVEGCVEVYMGTDSQFMSDEYAARFTVDGVAGTHLTMPGYRGLCHLFFRGGPGLNEGHYESLISSLGENGYDPYSPNAEPAEIGDPINTTYADRGFKWLANNPYIPEMKASVSRFSKALAGANYIINSGSPDEVVPQRVYSSEPVSITIPLHNGIGVGAGGQTRMVPIDHGLPEGSLTSAFYPTDVHVLPFDERTIEDGMVSYSWRVSYKFTASYYSIVSHQARFHSLTNRDGVLEGGSDPNYSESNYYQVSTSHWYSSGNNAFPGPGEMEHEQTAKLWPIYTRMLQWSGGANDQGTGTWLGGEAFLTYHPFITHCSIDGSAAQIGDANPAQIIYELLTNTEWGAQQPTASINASSFQAAAATLLAERFGLSFLWNRQTEVSEFIKIVLDHIQAFVFVNPETGLWDLKLIRNDYTIPDLAVLDPTNCDFTKQGRRAWGEVINEVVVVYTDPDSNEDASVSAHSATALALQGEVISETRNYPGICDPGLAKLVAQRDADQAGYPEWSGTARVSRDRWNTTPGTRFKLNWPEEGISEMVVMVVGVDYGKPRDRTITLELVEDVFARERTRYQAPQGSLWEPVAGTPGVLDHHLLIEAPMPMMQKYGISVADMNADHPGGTYLVPMGYDADRVVADIAINSSATDQVAIVAPRRTTTLAEALPRAVTSTIPRSTIEFLSQGSEGVGTRYMIGNNDETGELIELRSVDATHWTVRRGVWDTVPQEWGVGARIWSLGTGVGATDRTEHVTGEDVTYRFLPRVGSRRLEYAASGSARRVVAGRPHKPFRPANLGIDGDTGFDVKTYDPAPATLAVTWANRNRALEEDSTLAWNAASVSPESGQTTTIRVLDAQGTVIETITNLTGTSYTLTVTASMQEYGMEFIELRSVRDGIESLQAARRQVHLIGRGWAYNWDNDWGGTLGS